MTDKLQNLMARKRSLFEFSGAIPMVPNKNTTFENVWGD